MNERQILFSTEMVQAILDERKTVTRRVMRPQPSEGWEPSDYGTVHKLVNGVPDEMKPIGWGPTSNDGLEAYKSIYGKPGDILYVRETWKPLGQDPDDGEWIVQYKDGTSLNIGRMWPKEEEYKEIDFSERLADQYLKKGFIPWKPSIHMPKSASRIWLRVKDVRVERVQDITRYDIEQEGVDVVQGWDTIDVVFAKWIELWDSINSKRGFGWDVNPWVWAVLFDVISTTGRPEE